MVVLPSSRETIKCLQFSDNNGKSSQDCCLLEGRGHFYKISELEREKFVTWSLACIASSKQKHSSNDVEH